MAISSLPWQEPLSELVLRASLQPNKSRSIVIAPGRAFLRRLIDLTCKASNPRLFIRLYGNVGLPISMFLTDNAAVVAIINKTSSKYKIIMKLVKRLVLICLCNNILFKAKHVPGKHNVIADKLSRLEFHETLVIAPWLNRCPVQIPPHLLHI